MNLGAAAEESSREIHIQLISIGKCLINQSFLFSVRPCFQESGVSGALYPAVLIKTRQQDKLPLSGLRLLLSDTKGLGDCIEDLGHL